MLTKQQIILYYEHEEELFDGHKIVGVPTTKRVYIVNGKKNVKQ